jgi:hypothetical protein
MGDHSVRLVFKSLLITTLMVNIGQTTAWGATVWFASPDLRGVANDLADFISEKTGSKTPVEIPGTEPAFQKGDWVLSDVVKSPPQVVEGSLSRENRAYLQSNGQESFVAVNSGGIHYLVGGGQRGAVYASVRIQRNWIQSASPPLSVEFETLRGVPAFKDRIGGAGGPHPSEDFSQPKPADYDWETYAHDLAHRGINMTPGVIQGQVVPDEALKPWGIRKLVALSGSPFSQSDLRKWRATQPDEIKAGEDPRHPGSPSNNWVLCPGSEFAREKYKIWLAKSLADHKSVSKVVFYLADWGSIPGADCTPGASRWQRICSFLEEMGKLLKDVAPDASILLSTRGLAVEDLKQALPEGIGLYFEEPSLSVLDTASTGYDPSIASLEWDPVYGALLEQAIKDHPDLVYPVIAAGDTDRTVSPAIGMALPNTTFSKVQRLLDLKAHHIALDLGGIHPWVYSPNIEVFTEMIWSPAESAEDLIGRVARRDFGDAADEVVGVWNLFDQAFAVYPYINRAQRFEDMLHEGNDLILRPPIPSQIRNNVWTGSVGPAVPYLLESLPGVIKYWREGLLRLHQIPMESKGMDAKCLRDSAFWGGFLAQLLSTQYNTFRSLNLLHWVPEGVDPDTVPWRKAFIPVYRDEIQNCEQWQELLFTAPEPLIRLDQEAVNTTVLARKLDQKRQALERLVGN